ncbi:MAG: PQQ-binding-like beta-propeller repeat protein [Planctomycetota bacterium]
MSTARPARVVPQLPVLLVLLVIAGGVAWLQFGDGTGDGGVNNAMSYGAAILSLAIYVLWFLLGSHQRVGVRVTGLLVGLALVGGAFFLVRVEGWSGSMIPYLRWAWEPERESRLPTAATIPGAGEPSIDLVTTGPLDFPGFLGPDRSAAVRGVTLERDWDAQPPQLEWTVACGSGWSGFAVVNGVAITHEQRRGQQVVVARAVADGAELWRYASPGMYQLQLAGDGPRATPFVHAGRVYAHDALGRLTCLDGRDGSLVWEHDLRAMYGMGKELEEKLVQFGRSPSPIVHDGLVLIAAGGDPDGKQAGLVAFDAETGELAWEGPPRQLSHASPNVVEIAGRTQVVVTNEDTVSGHDPSDGTLLWEHPWDGTTSASANNSQPTLVGNDRILVSKGYGQGSKLLRITADESGAFTAEELWANRRALRTKFTNPVVHEGHAYALSDGILSCVDLATGDRVWRDGRYGHGQVLLAGAGAAAVLLVLSEEGELLMVEPSPSAENSVLGRVQALEGRTWNTIALYGDRVVVRNAEEAACWRLAVVER